MASTRDTILTAVRRWVMDSLEWTDETGAQRVIPSERGSEKGPRPSLPYLEVDVSVAGQTVGTDEVTYASGGKYNHGQRRGIVSFQGHGEATMDWLEMIAMNLDLVPDPLSITSVGQISDISELAGTSIEARFARDFDIAYTVIDGPRTFTPATTARADVDEDDQTIPITVDWS